MITGITTIKNNPFILSATDYCMLDQKYSTNSIITVLEPGKFNIEITEISETGTGRMVCSMEEIDLKTIRSLLKTLEEITSFNTEVEKVRGKCPY